VAGGRFRNSDGVDNDITLVTGGGDDRAFLHCLRPSPSKTNIIGEVSLPSSLSSSTLSVSPFSLESDTIPLSHPHTDSVSCVATNAPFVSLDYVKTPKYVAVGSYDGTIALYNPDNGAMIQTLDGPTDVEFLAFHPKGGMVLLVGSISDATTWMYHLPTSKCLQVFVGHECNGESGGVTNGSFSPNGKFALTVGMDGTLRIWTPRTGLCRHVFRLIDGGAAQQQQGLTCLGVNGGRDGQLAITGGENGNAYVVHIQGKKLVAVLPHFDIESSISTTSPPSSSSSKNNGMEEDEEDDAVTLATSVESVAFAPVAVNPSWAVTGGSDGKLKIWDLTHGGDGGSAQCRQVCSLQQQGCGVTRIVWHPTLPLIFSSYSDGSVRLWDARDGTLLHFLTTTGSKETSSGSGGDGEGDYQINDMFIEPITVSSNNEKGGDFLVVAGLDDGTIKVFRIDVEKAIVDNERRKIQSSS